MMVLNLKPFNLLIFSPCSITSLRFAVSLFVSCTNHAHTWKYLCFKWHKMSSKVVKQLLNNSLRKEYLLKWVSYIHVIAPKFASNSSSTWIICNTNDITTIYVNKVDMQLNKNIELCITSHIAMMVTIPTVITIFI
jgi:hypothetical protein